MTALLNGIIGEQGSGKTALMTKMLKRSADSGRQVIANYHLKFRYTAMPFSMLADLPPEVRNVDIGMDELGIGADSYDFLSQQSRKLTRLITQLRKREANVWYTVQKHSYVARRIRLETGRFYFMYDLDGDRIPKRGTHRDICAMQFQITCTNQYLDEMWHTDGKRIPHFDARPWIGLYDDREMIWE